MALAHPTAATAAAQAARESADTTESGFELRFESLFNPGRGLSFPCDAGGRVELDSLPDRLRHNYLYARAVVGREFAAPAVVRQRRH